MHAYTYKGQRRDPAAVKVARGQPAGDHSSRIVEMGKTDVYRDTMMFSKISESIILSLFKMAPKMVSTIFYVPFFGTQLFGREKNGYFDRKYRYILNFVDFVEMASKWYQAPFLVSISKRIMTFRLKISKFYR